MATWVTAPLSSKAQITLPKPVRQLLGVSAKGDRIGFLIDERAHRVFITKVKLVPEEPYTKEDIRKLLKLRKEPGGKTFRSMDDLLKDLKSP